MDNQKCLLSDLLEFSKSKNVKTSFKIETQNNFEIDFASKSKYNACTQSNLNKIETTSRVNNRLNNLIIFGIEESNEASNELERQKNDRIKVRNLMMPFCIDSSKKVTEIKRLNSKNDSISRPLLIKLIDYETRTYILKKAKNLKDIDQYKKIAISPDYSKAQRLKNKVLINNRIELNKQLRTETPNANYYFSISNGQIKMVKKLTETKKSIELTDIISNFNHQQLSNATNELMKMIKTEQTILNNRFKIIMEDQQSLKNDANDLTSMLLDISKHNKQTVENIKQLYNTNEDTNQVVTNYFNFQYKNHNL